MVISIASGKGGTGKTTVAVNMAFALEEGSQVLDCDVEEPNAHLFVKPTIDHTETVFAPIPEIDESKCTYCGKCADICRFKAIAVVAEAILTFPELCHSCGGCQAVCPEGAVTEKGRELGILARGGRGRVKFVHGRLRVGEAMSPPLIGKVREHIRPDLINIVDAPPGTSCPVIAAVRHTDFVVMVTEPTPFGLHDLKLGVEAVRLLGIPCGLVINRSDIGTNDVWAYAKKEQLPILMEIPFDRKIAEVYSQGGLIIDQLPEWKPRFRGLYTSILDLMDRGSEP